MAHAQQPSVDYVDSARVHLVRELDDVSVILDNLCQRGVLSGEEVSLINAEYDDSSKTRTLVDSVLKKGDAACYEFLRIIYVMRKKTSGRSSGLPERKKETSDKFDLDHWISCFTFNEDTHMDVQYLQGPRPCYRYQAKLKSQAEKISNEFWMESQKLFEGNKKPDLSYTPLVLEHTQENVCPSKAKKMKRKESKMSPPKALEKSVLEEKSDLSPSDLLKTDKNVLLVGKPGIGKTALAHELLRLWAERDSSELDYMFYFDMRDTSQIMAARSWEDLCFSGFCEPDEGKNELIQDMQKNSDNVTIIFDGVSQLCSDVVEKLMKKVLFPLAKVIITCRSDDEDEEFFPGDFDRVEVKGFSEQTIKTYLSATLDEEQKVLGNLELFTLCHVPMYALMVAVCFSSQESPEPCAATEMYISVVRYCLQINSRIEARDIDTLIKDKSKDILSLAEVSFKATQEKTVNLPELWCEDSGVLSFLKPLIKKVPNKTQNAYTFLHYVVQEFFAAVWLLEDPDEIRKVFQQCRTEGNKHLKHLIPFMCRLLNVKSPNLMEHLIPAEDLKNTSEWFFKELLDTFLCQKDVSDCEDTGPKVDLLFLCRCLYESQCPEACICLLNKLNCRLDLSGEDLDPYSCCAVAYVVNQSEERNIKLNLKDANISEQGMRRLFGCLEKVHRCDPFPQQLCKLFLLSEEEFDFATLFDLNGNQLDLPVENERHLFERAVQGLQKMNTNVHVCFYWDGATPVGQSLCSFLVEALPSISHLSVGLERSGEAVRLLVNVICAAAEREQQTGEKTLELLSSVCSYETFPYDYIEDQSNFLLDLYSHVKDCETKTGLSLLPSLQSVFQSAPPLWIINLSERKSSILLEVLKLQPEKKEVKLKDCSPEESEVRSFLQCLPYISQLRYIQ
ncbi:nucleotide-binding oligomerization domain-containing protein 1-like [Pholidichthys leucotaenia]